MSRLFTGRRRLLALALAAVVCSASALHAEQALQQLTAAPQQNPKLVPGKPGAGEADKLHVVLLVFGHRGGISAACLKDCKALRAVLETAFAADGHRLAFHDLSGKNQRTGKVFTTAETLDAVKNLKVGANDNVLVFQSGHGEIGKLNDPEMSHRLHMDGGVLTRGDIQRPIEEMKPRSIIFLTDCCSAIVRKRGGFGGGFVSLAQVQLNVPTVRNLMLRPSGPVAITAADDGKLAVATFKGPNPGKAGSAFTVAMLRLWYSETTYTSWGQFFPTLKTETGQASGGAHFARAFQLKDGIAAAAAP